jgi:probable rRNA maturation factor|tara:strand:- start:2225 stop:2692 length:468 start_codon:yes stop_codon:yes gene_type:complete
VPILESNIFITGNLEDLSCTQKDISEWVQALIDVEEGLDELITAKNINFSFVSEEEIQKLNLTFLKKDKPTNVLSFPSPATDLNQDLLGDIAICIDVIKKESYEQGKEAADHLIHIILHSVLHLVGYDHEDEASANKMELLEISTLKKIGIANPY